MLVEVYRTGNNNEGRELLRPPLLALEPQVYWSMVYHYNLNVDPNHPLCSTEGMLRLAMPTFDMSHLDRGG